VPYGAGAQVGISDWIADRPDPAEFFDGPFTCAGVRRPAVSGNVSGYCDRRTDALIAAAERAGTRDLAAAGRDWARIDARVTAAAPWIPFAGVRAAVLVSARTRGYADNPFYSILLDQISVR
jgi:ABC-type oligopeptide transport system substrate-binding subunit